MTPLRHPRHAVVAATLATLACSGLVHPPQGAAVSPQAAVTPEVTEAPHGAAVSPHVASLTPQGAAQTLDVAAQTSPVPPLTPPDAPLVEEVPAGWPGVDTDVAAHLLIDAENGQVLTSDDADVRRPVASTVKILTALSVVRRVELDEEVTIGAAAAAVPGSGAGLEAGEIWTVAELLDAMLARSGNDAAEALATHVAGDAEAFVELMARDAHRLGIEGATIAGVTGLDDANLLSAADLGLLARAALADDVLRPILGATHVELPSVGRVENRNELLLSYRGATGVKTGFTDAAGNSVVASARRGGRELIAVVLGAGEDPERFDVAAELLDLGFGRFAPEELGGRLRLSRGGGEVVHVVDPVTVTTPVDDPPRLQWPVPQRADGSLAVPVRAGTHEIAVLETRSNESDAIDGVASGDDAGGLGRAIADGVYAAMRAEVADDGSGSLMESSEGASS